MKQAIKEIWKKIIATTHQVTHSRSFGTFCLFLLLACFYWVGNALNSQRERKISLPIAYIGIPDSILFTEPLPTTFTVYLRDMGKRLLQYDSEYFNPLQIDLTAQLNGEFGHVQVPAEQVRKRIADYLQGTTQLQQIYPENIDVSFYKQHHKNVPIQWKGSIHLDSQYQFIQAPQMLPNTVDIYGSQEVLADIHAIETESIEIPNMRDSVVTEVNLVIPQGVRVSQATTTVYATAELFTEKVFNLPINTIGVPAHTTLRLFPPSVDVTVRVGLSHFHEVSAKDINVTCIYPVNHIDNLPIQISYSSPYITFARSNPSSVEYIIER